MGYDIIGDVHGHAAASEALLEALGYRFDGEEELSEGKFVAVEVPGA